MKHLSAAHDFMVCERQWGDRRDEIHSSLVNLLKRSY